MAEEEINGYYNPQMTMNHDWHEKMHSEPLVYSPAFLVCFSFFPPFFFWMRLFSFISLMSFVVPLAQDDFVLTKGADSSDNSPDKHRKQTTA